MRFQALVLAGSRGGTDPVAAYAGVSEKALVEVAGTSMLERVIHALRAAGAERIAVSTASTRVAEHARALAAHVLPAAVGPSASTAAALAAWGAPLLVTTADHALLRPEWVTAFLEAAPVEADASVLLARRETIEAAVPTTRRTYLQFGDGDWSGCNLFFLGTPAAERAIALWQRVEADRKRPWRIVRRLGAGMLLRYLFRQLTLGQALDALGGRTDVRLAAVESPFGLAAIDVDKPDDLDLVRSIERRAGASASAQR